MSRTGGSCRSRCSPRAAGVWATRSGGGDFGKPRTARRVRGRPPRLRGRRLRRPCARGGGDRSLRARLASAGAHPRERLVDGGVPVVRVWLLRRERELDGQPLRRHGPLHDTGREPQPNRELAALQTFPTEYMFYGDRRSVQRQIGNAVPSAIGELLGNEIRCQFFGERPERNLTLIPSRRRDRPPAERRRKVPAKYFQLRKQYGEHPGPGRGPGARRRKAQKSRKK